MTSGSADGPGGPDAGGPGAGQVEAEVEAEVEPSAEIAQPRLILASGSPRRRDILRQLDLEPEIRAADVDETYLPGESPEEHVERLARLKAETVLAKRGGSPSLLVVGGDTVVVDGGTVLAKPVDEDDAVAMLVSLSGKRHEVLSGLALVAPGGTDGVVRTVSGVARTVVRMRSFDEETARRYVATGEPMDKAGGYGIQGRGAALVAGVEGDYYSVVGFPVGLFLDLLARVGWRFAFGSLTPDSSTS